MRNKSEPKFIVKYVKSTKSIEEQRKAYELYIIFLVEVYKKEKLKEKG